MFIHTAPARVFSDAAAAAAHIAALGGNDDTTSYVVKADPAGSGRAIVEIYDVADGFIGHLDF